MGAGTIWYCSVCQTLYNKKDEEPKHTDSRGKWICSRCYEKQCKELAEYKEKRKWW